jgi:hypothetical protein
MCWRCGHLLTNTRYLSRAGAPWVLYLHTSCILPVVWGLVAEWRAARVAAEHQE